MTLLRKISLFQFRNYQQSSFSLQENTVCICGSNGSGKTNLLDAIYTLCYTKSYFSATLNPTIMYGKDAYRIEGMFEQNNKQELVACKIKNGKKEISCGGLVYDKHAEHIGKYAAVMIAPDDIELINEGSEYRRKFIDAILSQCDRNYLSNIITYQKIIQQRNGWLKMFALGQQTDYALLDYYDGLLIPLSQYIFQARLSFAAIFNPLLQEFYEQLCSGKEQVQLVYQSDLQQYPIETLLKNNITQDIRLQRSSKGIHKDDLHFLINNKALKNYGSQGQKKSFLFALKMAQYEYINAQAKSKPILLLDDVFEKLDQKRMEALLKIISHDNFGQVILTDTHAERVVAAFKNPKNIDIINV